MSGKILQMLGNNGGWGQQGAGGGCSVGWVGGLEERRK